MPVGWLHFRSARSKNPFPTGQRQRWAGGASVAVTVDRGQLPDVEQEDEHAVVRAQVFMAAAGPGSRTSRFPRRCNVGQARRPRTYLGDRADEEDRAWDTRLQMMGRLVLEEASAELAGTTTTDPLVPPSKYNRDPEETTAQAATSLRVAHDGFREILGSEK